MKTGELREIEIESLAYGGSGVGRTDGQVIFVPHTAPGDLALVEVTEVKDRFLRGRIREIRRPSPDRTKPLCGSYGKCGGCHYQHLGYERQLYWKQVQVNDALTRIGGLETPPLAPIIPSPVGYHYRGKAEFHVAEGGDGRFRIGFHQEESNLLVEIDPCEIADGSINHALQRLRQDLGAGKIRALPARLPIWSSSDGEGLICTNAKRTVERQVKDMVLSVPAAGFFQANLFLVNRLVDLVVELCALEGTETVVDCYCGSGLFSLFLADRAGRLFGIEADSAALSLARLNLTRAGRQETLFFAGDVGRELTERFVRGGIKTDVLVLDPPRPGLAKEVMAGIFSLQPRRLVYISCNPATLARDIRHLSAAGYLLRSVHPLDMFPQTAHIEVVALLEAKV
ncbi:MAG: class I SAM-dependent RNA methyltransferase [Smithellaceae bacterium]|nr:class I SAM-dependent RNA methyltransferase [Smithellaceae bacterium]